MNSERWRGDSGFGASKPQVESGTVRPEVLGVGPDFPGQPAQDHSHGVGKASWHRGGHDLFGQVDEAVARVRPWLAPCFLGSCVQAHVELVPDLVQGLGIRRGGG